MHKIEACLTTKTDLKKMAQMAYAHGLFPLFFKAMSHKRSMLDEDDYAELKRIHLEDTLQKMRMVSELQRLVTLLNDASIDVAVLKGPVLAQMCYGNVADRQYTDLDLLVSKARLWQTATLLVEAGYTPLRDIAYLKDHCFLDAAKDLAFLHQTLGVKVELHWKLFENRFTSGALAVDESVKVPVSMQTFVAMTLEAEMLLLYLCMHGAWHDWQRLVWINDLDRLLRTTQIDWPRMLTAARTAKAETMLKLGLLLAHKLYTTPLDDAIMHSILSHRRAVRLAHEILEAQEREEFVSDEGFKATMRKVLRYMDGCKVTYLLGMVLKIKPEDVLEAPRRLPMCFMYYPWRLKRLFG